MEIGNCERVESRPVIYLVGIRLFVTYPFTFTNDLRKSLHVAEVLRVDKLGDGRFGVAIRLMTV
jgi:hypothetical protein